MAHTWKFAIGLGFLSAALIGGCTVKEGDDDDASGAGGESANGGTGGTTGGSAGKGGSAGTAAKGGSAGSGTAGKGGSAGSGTGGTTGGSAGSGTGGSGAVGGAEGGAAGAGDSGGTGGSEPMATCDPADGELDSTPYPNCDADPSDDPCQVCIQASCCEESKTCYGTEPYNVCGWGGPTDGKYAGFSEIGCFQRCLSDAVKANEMTCTTEDADTCAADCATTMCFEGAGQIALIGNATNDLAACMQDNCADKCFGADSCGN